MNEEKDLLDQIVEDVKNETSQKKSADEKNVAEMGKTSEKVEKIPSLSPELSDMEAFLESDDVVLPAVGDVIFGKVIDITTNVVLVDLPRVGTGMVIGREAKSGLSGDEKLHVGGEIEATVTDLYNEDGYIELSIREASYEKAWDDLRDRKEQEETVKTKILDANKGGLIIEINGITGFLPVSQLSSKNYPRVEDGDKNKILELLKQLIAKELPVRILDVDQESEKLIVSEKAAHSDEERKAISGLAIGNVVDGEVSGVVDFGAFVKFTIGKEEEDMHLEGLVHISELAWQLINNPREIIKVGDKVSAKIIGIDDTRISLSVKALLNDPWTNIEKKYAVGGIYKGTVDKVNPFGAFVYLDQDIHGLAHVSEFQDAYPGKKFDATVTVGKEYSWKVLSIESKEHRMGLVYVEEGKESVEAPIKAVKSDKEEVTA